MTLKGRRAFITGSFQGIGLGIATALAKEGADIVLHGLATDEVIVGNEFVLLDVTVDRITFEEPPM